MLIELADHCDTENATESLMEAVGDWRKVGESADTDTCKRYLDEQLVGCTGAGSVPAYDEIDALVDCS